MTNDGTGQGLRAALAVALIVMACAVGGEAAVLPPAPARPAEEGQAPRPFGAVKRLRHFLDKTDSEIATRQASETGLRAQVDATAPAHRVVVQNNITDWEFLEQLARRNGFRVWVDECEGTLHFRKAPLPAGRR